MIEDYQERENKENEFHYWSHLIKIISLLDNLQVNFESIQDEIKHIVRIAKDLLAWFDEQKDMEQMLPVITILHA